MFTAQYQPDKGAINLLDPRWLAQIETLRSLDRRDALVCPGCQQPVRVRAGQFKRPHFAHKHLQNCPFERESARLLHTRAVLYDWLAGKFGAEAVRVEKQIDAQGLPRHFDCWIETAERTFAYWIFDRRVPPDERQSLKAACTQLGVDVQWVFVVDLLHPDDLTPGSRLHLTTTERAFMRQSELDQAWQTHFEHVGGSLHYLDPDALTLTTYRNLTLVHEPQLYAGKQLHTALAEVLVSPTTGEFVHPGETAQLQHTRSKMTAQEQKTAERLQRARDFLEGASLRPWSATTSKSPPAPASPPDPLEREGTCKICGQITREWVTYFGQTKACICRECAGTAHKHR